MTRAYSALTTFLVSLLLVGLSASSASALTTEFGGGDDPSLHGATGSLSISGPIMEETGTYDVVWSMDFAGYEGSVDDHQYLTHIAFKAFSDISAVTLESTTWDSAVSGTALYPSNVNNGGCTAGSNAKMVCVTLDSDVDATMGGEFSARFSVTGDLNLSEWSYRGKFGPEDGWVISESAAPIPEPSAALVFAAGIGVISARMRSRR
jgi:hypothetical protein